MSIKDQITIIDEALSSKLPHDCGVARWSVQNYGLVRNLWNQNNNGFLLHYEDENGEQQKVTIDDSFDVQTMHVHMEVPLDQFVPWGSFRENSFLFRMKMVVVTRKKTVMDKFLMGFNEIENVEFIALGADTEQTMRNELKILPGKLNEKNFPPEYRAFVLYYNVSSIDLPDEDEE